MFPYILLMKCSRIWIINVTETNNVATNMILFVCLFPLCVFSILVSWSRFLWVCFLCFVKMCSFPVCKSYVYERSSMRNRCLHWKLHFILCIGLKKCYLFCKMNENGWQMTSPQTIPFFIRTNVTAHKYYGHFDYFFFNFFFFRLSSFLLLYQHKCDAHSYLLK